MVQYGEIRNTDEVVASSGTTITTATRAPSDADGATGDYWLDSVARILHGPKAGVATPVDVLAINPSATPTTTFSGSYSLGLKLQFVTTGLVAALRFWRPAGSAQTSRTLTLYRAGVSVGTATSSAADETGSGWKTVTLGSPVAVDAGVDYIVAHHANGQYMQVDGNPGSYSPTYITNITGCYAAGLALPTTNVATNYFADVVFHPTGGPTIPMWPLAIKSATI